MNSTSNLLVLQTYSRRRDASRYGAMLDPHTNGVLREHIIQQSYYGNSRLGTGLSRKVIKITKCTCVQAQKPASMCSERGKFLNSKWSLIGCCCLEFFVFQSLRFCFWTQKHISTKKWWWQNKLDYSRDLAIRTYNKNKTLWFGEKCDPTKWGILLDKIFVRYPSRNYSVLIWNAGSSFLQHFWPSLCQKPPQLLGG